MFSKNELETYMDALKDRFNDTHNTNFGVKLFWDPTKFGFKSTNSLLFRETILWKNTKLILIFIGYRFTSAASSDVISASKILLGHEFSHQVYYKGDERDVGTLVGKLKSMCTEAAMDIAGQKFLIDSGVTITGDILNNFEDLISDSVSDIKALNKGYPTIANRLKYMRKVSTFDENDYEIVVDIAKDANEILKKYELTELTETEISEVRDYFRKIKLTKKVR